MNAYDGCIPVTVYMLQEYVGVCIFGKWVNINGFSDKEKAEALMWLLEHETKHKSKKTMKTEDNKRMEALAYIIADLKAENMEMTQRVHQLTDVNNEAVHQQHGLEERKDENSFKQTLGEMIKMRDHCDELEKKNGELEQRVHQLTADYNAAVHQLGCKEACKDENSSNQMPEEMQQMFDRCSELELENEKLNRIAKEFNYFVEDKKLYMKNKLSCGYKQDRPVVGFKSCQECSSYLGFIEGLGVICKKRLAYAKVSFPADE